MRGSRRAQSESWSYGGGVEMMQMRCSYMKLSKLTKNKKCMNTILSVQNTTVWAVGTPSFIHGLSLANFCSRTNYSYSFFPLLLPSLPALPLPLLYDGPSNLRLFFSLALLSGFGQTHRKLRRQWGENVFSKFHLPSSTRSKKQQQAF